MTFSSPSFSSHAPMKIGFVGCGQITEVHRDGYRLFGLPVVAGTDVSAEAREKFQSQDPQARVYESLDELLGDPEIEVFDVAAPHRQDIREPLLEKVVRAGKPVLLQKPFAHAYEDALRYTRLFEDAGVPLMINQNSVFSGGVIEMTDRVLRSQEMGRLLCGRITNMYDFDPGDHPWYGKNARWWLTDMAVHEMALLHHFLGAPESVSAAWGRDPAQKGVRGDGFFQIFHRYADGSSALINESGAYYGQEHLSCGFELQGESGILEIITGKQAVLSRRGEPKLEILSPYRWFPEAFGLVMHHFQHALRAGAQPLCSSLDNLYVIATIEAAYRSAETGRSVRLGEIMGDRYDGQHGPGGLAGLSEWTAPVPNLKATLIRNY